MSGISVHIYNTRLDQRDKITKTNDLYHIYISVYLSDVEVVEALLKYTLLVKLICIVVPVFFEESAISSHLGTATVDLV